MSTPDPGEAPGPAARLFDAIGAQLVLAESLGDGYPRVGSDYEVRRILGGGGFGLVCEAEQLNLKRRVALKLFPLGGEGDAGVREALREARSLAKLEHASIVGVMDAGESELIAVETLPCAFVEMQLVEGQDLRAWLETEPRTAKTVVGVLIEAGRALAFAHAKQIVHRDFKPENLMIDASGHACVVDFGLAIAGQRASAEVIDALGSRSTRTGMVRGTPAYLAPEALAAEPSPASDQFALAVALREALTGKHPFVSQTLPGPSVEGGAELAKALAPIIDRAMSVAPDDRYASVDAFCDALEAELRPTSLTTPPAAEPSSIRRVGLAVAAVAAVALGAWAVSEAAPDAEPPERPTPTKLVGKAPAPLDKPAPPEAPAPTERLQPDVASPPKTSPAGGGDCSELEDWDGPWKLGARVLWSEFPYQLHWNLGYEVDLRFGEDCSVQADWTKHPGWLHGRPPGPPLAGVAAGRASPAPTGGWSLSFRLDFPGDRKTYAKDELYSFDLHLDRKDDQPRLRGAFTKLNEDGQRLRNGILSGDRQRTQASFSLRLDDQDCETRCIVECAGKRPTRICRTRTCTAEELAEPLCTAPSLGFQPPLRAYVARKTVLEGETPLGRDLARGSNNARLDQCREHARGLVGTWSIWRTSANGDPTELSVDLEKDSGCRLEGRAARVDGSEPTALRAEVTSHGTWLLTPETPTASFPHPFVLIGVGADAPAFGIDAGPSPGRLRAQRKAVGP